MSQPDSSHIMMPDLSVPFVAAVYAIIDGQDLVEEAADLLHDIEQRTKFFVHTAEDHINKYAPDDEEHSVALKSFLDETRMVVAGGEICNAVEMCDPEGRSYELTWREWGAKVADWANSRGLILQQHPGKPRPGYTTGPWEYLDFYMVPYRGTHFHKYDDWATTVLKVIEYKSKKFPFSPS